MINLRKNRFLSPTNNIMPDLAEFMTTQDACAGYLPHPSVFFGILGGNFVRRFSFSIQGGLGLFYEYAPGSFG
jgi:hypothetical protein